VTTKPPVVIDAPQDVDAYISNAPRDVQPKLRQLRAAIRRVAPGALETTSYFDIPGYSYPGYDYNGMFVWFSYQATFVGLHLRPPTLEDHAKEVRGYAGTKSILRLPIDGELPVPLIERLVRSSLRVMKEKKRPESAKAPSRSGRR
jgi:uncharacterized protein YdhG (YjbR/CyaY superfamily)